MNIKKEAVKLHAKLKGKIETKPKTRVTKKLLSLLYTPGVAEISRRIHRNRKDVYRYTSKGNTIAIVSDGTRVLGLGNIGPEAALPVMEGKALLFKAYGNVDAVPICVKTQDAGEIIKLVEEISPVFGAINLEDIESPKCFEIAEKLAERLDIPVFHDDQHGTAVVVVAALLNALKVVNKNLRTAKIVVFGAGAAGYMITRLLVYAGARNILVLDSKGVIYRKRRDLNKYKRLIASLTNPKQINGKLEHAIEGSDVVIGVSAQKNVLHARDVRRMNNKAIIFALTNPDPEIMPDEAKRGGASVVATGRSDFPNQVNNVVVFPFLMRKILDERIKKIDLKLLYDASKKIAAMVKKPTAEKIIPSVKDIGKL